MGKSILILLLLPFSLLGQLEIQQVTENVFVYTTYQELPSGKFPSNSMYVVTDEGIVMIDTPWDKSQLRSLIDSMWVKHQQRPVLCISTHWHDDRTNGVNFLDSIGALTYCSSSTIELCQEHNAEQPKFTFTQDTTFSIGGIEFQTYYPGAGHTYDNQLIYIPSNNLLYGGCFIKSYKAQNIGYTKDGNIIKWKANISKIQRQYPQAEYIITGHESWDQSRRNIKRTKQLLRKSIRKLSWAERRIYCQG